jgi:hypothetical protein
MISITRHGGLALPETPLFLNQYSLFTMGWMVNTDIHPATTLIGLVKYIAKYVSKPEKASMAYKDIESQVLKYTSDKSPLLSFTSKTLVGERDYSAQEVSHILLQLPMFKG